MKRLAEPVEFPPAPGIPRPAPPVQPWRRALHVLVPPPRRDLSPERARRAWLVGALAAGGGPVTGFILVLMMVLRGDFSAWPALVSIGGFALAWVFSQRAHDLQATWLLCWACFAGPAIGLVVNPLREFNFQIYSLYLPAFLASVLLSPLAAGLLVAAAEVMLVAAHRLTPGLDPLHVQSAMVFGLAVAPVTVLSAVLVKRDLTQLHAQARALTAARDDALASSEGKSRFLARAGHELRTPLTGALGYTDLVLEALKGRGEDVLADDVIRARRSLELLRALVEEVLTLSRIDLGQLPVHARPVDAAVLLQECADMVRLQCEEGGNTLRLELEDGPMVITTDGQKLSQVMLNLLVNAARATRNGSITLRARRDPALQGGVLLSVEDTGVGMGPAEVARAFDEFWQGPRPPSAAKGAGLGLTICRQLCGLVGAGISVESAVGKGSTFTVRVPPAVPSGNHTAR